MKKKKIKEYCKGAGRWVRTDKRKITRCPVCRRRLLSTLVFCVGGEFVGYKVPKHKEK